MNDSGVIQVLGLGQSVEVSLLPAPPASTGRGFLHSRPHQPPGNAQTERTGEPP